MKYHAFTALLLIAMVACGPNTNKALSKAEKDSLETVANNLIGNTAGLLIGELQGVLDSSNRRTALSYCQLRAPAITDSLSNTINQAEISRIAIKNRNPMNRADSYEVHILRRMEKMINTGVTKADTLVRRDNALVIYKPILLSSFCEKCHGDFNLDRDSAFLAELHKLYPNDEAVGFREGDLRGAWKVKFPDFYSR